MVSYIQAILGGATLPVSWRGMLGGAQLFGLAKPGDIPDGSIEQRKLRPICAGAILRRILSRVVCASQHDDFASHFFPSTEELTQARSSGTGIPIQTAVGVSGGMEILTHLVQAYLDVHRDHVDVKVDAKNAFNSLHRRYIIGEVEEHFPDLGPYTRAMYDPAHRDFVAHSGFRCVVSAHLRGGGAAGGPFVTVLLLPGHSPSIAASGSSFS
jgi:hypothetical protein